jgi:nuclear pore complex protein Nup155
MANNARPLGQVLGPPLPSTSTALPLSTQAHVSPPNLDLPILQGASRVIQDYFAKDSQIIPDIGELLVLRRSVQ